MNDAREDVIFLRGLECPCTIGFIEWERHVPQTVSIDLEFPVDCVRAARQDAVADTVDYKRVAKRTLGWVGETKFRLVESLAQQLALLLLTEFGMEWIRISITKPGAIRHARDVGVRIERRRADLPAAGS
jgi:dihydroneopterin aldolase